MGIYFHKFLNAFAPATILMGIGGIKNASLYKGNSLEAIDYVLAKKTMQKFHVMFLILYAKQYLFALFKI